MYSQQDNYALISGKPFGWANALKVLCAKNVQHFLNFLPNLFAQKEQHVAVADQLRTTLSDQAQVLMRSPLFFFALRLI